MDVKTIFLNDDLEEVLYITKPMSFVDLNNTEVIVKCYTDSNLILMIPDCSQGIYSSSMMVI
jgi:hypothetical protein